MSLLLAKWQRRRAKRPADRGHSTRAMAPYSVAGHSTVPRGSNVLSRLQISADNRHTKGVIKIARLLTCLLARLTSEAFAT
jgi:hypothetical protein